MIEFIWQLITGWFGDYSTLKWFVDTAIVYLFFAWIMVLDRLTKDLTGWRRIIFRNILAMPIAMVGYFFDIRLNATWGNIMFLELPSWIRLKNNLSFRHLTLTARLKRHIAGPRKTILDRYRYGLATRLCWLAENWDPEHCR